MAQQPRLSSTLLLAPQRLALKSFVELTGFANGDGGNRQGSPRRSRISRKAIAQGGPVVTACTCGFRARAISILRESPGCMRPPGLPCALRLREGYDRSKARAKSAARMRCHALYAVIARSKATKQSRAMPTTLDC